LDCSADMYKCIILDKQVQHVTSTHHTTWFSRSRSQWHTWCGHLSDLCTISLRI
jgi:hypothetical protein